jgi:predicted negative regulator of RcsB-dependent stress response
MSIRKFDLLFTNFPATPYMEEALYLQSLNYLLLGSAAQSQDLLDKLAKQYPESEFRSQTLKVSGDNAFALERWAEAEQHYSDYLERFPEAEDWDRIGLKLGECRWELDDFQGAADVLQEAVEKTDSQELGFRSGLLRAKCLVRTGEYDLASDLLGELEDKATIYSAQGDVLLTQVELLVAQGRPEDAFPVLETMPDEWKTPQVKARAADLQGNLRMARNELEEAQLAFKDAMLGKAFLDDEHRTRRLNENLKDYLAAENSLPDASPDRVPRLKLLQANAMLFGFERPGEAIRLYREAAADSAADSTVAARSLYGAAKVYREYLDRPDSAEHYAQLLQERYPDSPQAFELSVSGGGNLLAFLLDRRTEDQAQRYASLSEEERAALQELKEFEAGAGPGATASLLRLRRRMIYFARRPNVEFPPPPLALAAAEQRRDEAAGADAAAGEGEQPAGEPAQPVDPAAGPTDPAARPLGLDAAARAADETRTADPRNPEALEDQTQEAQETEADGEATEEEETEDEEDKEDKEDKKKKRRSWEFDLRSPAPRPSAEIRP